MPRSYPYDIFLSYSHLDNKTIGQAGGWILSFYENLGVLLQQLLGTEDVRIWWDKGKLEGTKIFDESIQQGVRSSALLLCLTSRGYLNSDYCHKELSLFHENASRDPLGLKIADSSRIVHIQLQNISHKDPAWPHQFIGTTGFAFHQPVKDSEDLGFPLAPGSTGYNEQLQSLVSALRKLLLAFPPNTAGVTSRASEDNDEQDPFTVFIGDVHDDLQPVRRRITRELTDAGIRTLPSIPPPYDAASHEEQVIDSLKAADLSIHLLHSRPGREIEGMENKWYPPAQAGLALQHAGAKIIWVPADLQPADIEEEAYRSLLSDIETGHPDQTNIDFIRSDKSALIQTLVTATKQLQASKSKPSGQKISFLLDTHFNDHSYALELSQVMSKRDVRTYINPHEDEPAKNIKLLEDRISMVTKLIFLYGKVSASWVEERMNAVLKLIINNDYAVDEFFVLTVPPDNDKQKIQLQQKWLKVNVLPFGQFLADLNTSIR